MTFIKSLPFFGMFLNGYQMVLIKITIDIAMQPPPSKDLNIWPCMMDSHRFGEKRTIRNAGNAF